MTNDKLKIKISDFKPEGKWQGCNYTIPQSMVVGKTKIYEEYLDENREKKWGGNMYDFVQIDPSTLWLIPDRRVKQDKYQPDCLSFYIDRHWKNPVINLDKVTTTKGLTLAGLFKSGMEETKKYYQEHPELIDPQVKETTLAPEGRNLMVNDLLKSKFHKGEINGKIITGIPYDTTLNFLLPIHDVTNLAENEFSFKIDIDHDYAILPITMDKLYSARINDVNAKLNSGVVWKYQIKKTNDNQHYEIIDNVLHQKMGTAFSTWDDAHNYLQEHNLKNEKIILPHEENLEKER